MTRRFVIALAFAVVIATGVVAVHAQGGGDTLQVGPNGEAGEKSTSEPLYAGKRYRVTIEGTLTRTATQVDRQELDAFWCFDCGGDPYKSHGLNARADDGEFNPYAPEHYTKAGTTPSYNAEHRYVLIFDNIEETRKLIFRSNPPSPDDTGYAGGFKVTIEPLDPEPKECKVTRYGRNPRDGQVAWLFTQGGRPTSYEATLKDSITVGRGVARIGHRRTAAYDLDNARGEVCHKDRHGITDPDPPHGELDFGAEQLKFKVIANDRYNSLRPATGQESLRLRVKVVESDDPDCAVGTKAFAVLIDEQGHRRDTVRLFEFASGQCGQHEHTYRRGVQVVINPDYPRPAS